jgi:peptidoglycan/LPS O-acetylase OafA/YrhL
VTSPSAPAKRTADALGLVTIAVICFASKVDSPYLYEWGNTLVAAAATAVVAVCVLPGSAIGRAFELMFLRATGRISYSLYLWHLPVFVWVATHLDWPALPEMAIAVALSYAIATAAYFVAEYPVLRTRPHVLRSPRSRV